MKKGFTLIELLCALAIIAIVATLTLSLGARKVRQMKQRARGAGVSHLATVSLLAGADENYENGADHDRTISQILGAE